MLRLTLSMKVFTFPALCVLVIGWMLAAIHHVASDVNEIGINEVGEAILEGEKAKLQVAVHAMATTLGEGLKGAAPGALLRDVVRGTKYGEDGAGYFFIVRGTAFVSHPSEKLIGKDYAEVADRDGVHYIRELAAQARGGGGFVSYVFDKPGKGETPKISYAEMIPGTDLWLGSGVYLDSVEAARAKVLEHSEVEVARTTRMVLIVAAVVLFGLVIPLAFFISRGIRGPIAAMVEAAERIAQGDVKAAIAHHGRDEIGRLADSFRAMVTYVQDAARAGAAVADGDLAVEIQSRGEHDQLAGSLGRVRAEVGLLVTEVQTLVQAAAQGRLGERLDPARFRGQYGALAAAVNHMLDAVVAPLDDATRVLERMAARDLTAAIEGSYQGDHARLAMSLETALQNVRETLAQASHGAEQVKAASSQVASGSQVLASGASSQASALAKVRDTMVRLTQTSDDNASHAERARELTADARLRSARGSEALRVLAETVAGIQAEVVNTAVIARDINAIAFQTNLLSLNAAVEAARAGAAGGGFAVVAEEVRQLAGKAKEAAQKTEQILEGAVGQARRGSQITREVVDGLASIVSAVESVDGIVAEMAAASRAQARDVETVAEAATQMDDVTQENAAGAEEMASTAEELSAHASELTDMVHRFTLEAPAKSPVDLRSMVLVNTWNSRSVAAVGRPSVNGVRQSQTRAAVRVNQGSAAARSR